MHIFYRYTALLKNLLLWQILVLVQKCLECNIKQIVKLGVRICINMQLELGKGRPPSDNIEEETPVIHNISIDISHAFTQSLTYILEGWINQPLFEWEYLIIITSNIFSHYRHETRKFLLQQIDFRSSASFLLSLELCCEFPPSFRSS